MLAERQRPRACRSERRCPRACRSEEVSPVVGDASSNRARCTHTHTQGGRKQTLEGCWNTVRPYDVLRVDGANFPPQCCKLCGPLHVITSIRGHFGSSFSPHRESSRSSDHAPLSHVHASRMLAGAFGHHRCAALPWHHPSRIPLDMRSRSPSLWGDRV